MRHRFRRLAWTAVLAVGLLMSSSLAYAQGGATSTLAGTVVDTSGGVVPGADIVVKNVATGAVFTTVSGSDGGFLIPAMPPGTYAATVSLQGFKTVELKDIVLNVAVTASVKAVLELGKIEESVVVTGATEIVQTQATSVASTMTALQISNLPVAGRGAFDLVRFMPGVSTTTGSVRDGSINGLPHATINITLDGMNIQDNYAKTWDGMFTRVSPRLDAVEEVTISTAAQGADVGQGAAQVRFVTRSGTNRYQGSVYYYFRRDWMNTNTWFNLNRNVDATGKPAAKPPLVQYQPGGRFGGPILKDKLFFFVNYEWVKSPGTNGRTVTIMSPLSEQGIFQYSKGTVNLWTLAASKGQTPTPDPTVAQLLADVRASTTCGTCTLNDVPNDPLTQTLFWQQPTLGKTTYPTLKIDYNLTSKHRVSASITQNHLISDPDTTNTRQRVYPGFPVQGLQDSYRWVSQLSVRSVLTKNMVNEVRIGGTGGATQFSPNTKPEMFNNTGGPGDMKGYWISWSAFRSINNPAPGSGYSAREGSTRLIEDTLSWLKGKHSLTMGGSVTRGDVWLFNRQNVPDITFGMASGDPADSMFSTANFPGASSTELGYARNLYAVLTGRITTIGRNARIGDDGKTYKILGESNQYGRIWQLGFFAQDSWRVRPSLTVNGGLRWEIQLPFYALNNSYSTATIDDVFGVTGPGAGFTPGSNVTGIGNLFKPGVFEGRAPTYQMLEKGVKAYNTDWNNLAPSVGAAWTIGADSGFWHGLLGAHGDSVIRGGYNIAYQRGGMNDFTEVYGANPGIQIDASRSLANGNLGTLPVLFRSSDLGPPTNIPLERTYPMSVPTFSSNIRMFDPNIRLPWAESGTIGWQRALAKNMAVEVRYIYSRSHDRWTLGDIGQRNYNEINYVETGFLNEFRLAQANLAANTAANNGRGFAYTGIPGTSPLPIFLAHYNKPTDTPYSGSAWTNSTLVGYLSAYNPNPYSMVTSSTNGLRYVSTYRDNMKLWGYPSNFWVVNPEVTGAYIATNGPDQRYNGLQVIFTRRMSQGLQLNANYTFGRGYQWDFYSLRVPYVKRVQTWTNSSAASGNINHNLAVTWVYELPFGQGRALASNAGGFLHRLIGDWNIIGGATFATGRLVDFGNVNLNGFTKKDLQKMFKLRRTVDSNNQYRTLVWILPQDVIDNTVKAYSVTATGYSAGEPTGRYFSPQNSPTCLETVSGYGDCAARSVVIQGPPVMRLDLTISKRIPIRGRVGAEFQIMIFNVTNRVNFNPVTGIGNVVDDYQVTGAVDQSRTMQLAFRINF